MPSRFSHVVIFLVLMMSLGSVRSSAQAGPASGLPAWRFVGSALALRKVLSLSAWKMKQESPTRSSVRRFSKRTGWSSPRKPFC